MMTTRRSIFLLLITGVATTTIFFFIYFTSLTEVDQALANEQKSYEEVNLAADYIVFNNAESLSNAADLIIIGIPVDDFSKREHIIRYSEPSKKIPQAHIMSIATMTNVEVVKVLKSDRDAVEYNHITVVEPISVLEGYTEIPKKLTYGDYEELKSGHQYLIFLKRNSLGQYAVINMNNGRFSLDDQDEKDNVKNDRFKQEVVNFFQNKL